MSKCFYIVAFLMAFFLCTDSFAQLECVADSASMNMPNRFAARPLATDEVFGDLNGDGEVDVADIVTIINIMKGDYDPKTLQIVNRSSKTLYSFTIFFGDINDNLMSSEERGDLYPGDKTILKIPVGVYTLDFVYYDKELNSWIRSPKYDVENKAFTIDDSMISQWVTSSLLQITNRSGMILYQFTVVWGDVNDNVMSKDVKGDLYSGDKITVEVPVGAYKFYMAYYNKNLGTWQYSPIYSVGRNTFTLTAFDISQWTTD